MTITVEFFGIARKRAGLSSIEIDADSVGAAFDLLADRIPHWAEACLDDGHLKKSFLANINGRTFVSDRDRPLKDGDHLLILAADVGG
ncbi:MAG: MoaD/ThiS family protein [Planctomycetaceae bacterium]|nr:MoaD/ThiS family protein [Planctomycetaceae bacterium]